MTDTYHTEAARQPGVLTWFKVYCGVLCLVYLAVAAVSLIFFLVPSVEMDMPPELARIMGVVFLAIGLLLFGVCVLPFFVAPRPWVWVYGIVLICLGITSPCLLPVCIPLLIFWIKPEAQRYFGRG